MAVVGEALVDFKARVEDLERRGQSQVVGAVKKIAIAAGGIFAAQKIFDFGADAFRAAEESAKIGRQTEAVIKSMGLQSVITADQIGDLATALSRKNGVDDEAIQSGTNLLLTFSNLAATAGESGGIFERTNQIMVDMAAAMGTDASASAIQLGKALNDPTRGLTALTRVGVSFTEQQRDQIKALQDSGDITGAQAILLAELEKQFGGSAAAQATAADRLKIAMGNLQEEIGARLIPVVEGLANFMLRYGLPAFDKMLEVTDQLFRAVGSKVGPVFDKIAMGVRAAVAAFREGDVTSDGFIGTMERIGVAVRELADTWLPRLQTAVRFVADNWQAFAAGLLVVLSPITAVAAGLVLLYTRSETFREVIAALGQAISVAFTFIGEQVAALRGWWEENWSGIEEAIGHIVTVVAAVGEQLIALWDAWGGRVLAIVTIVWDMIRVQIETVITVIRNVIELVLNLINGDFDEAGKNLLNIVRAIWDAIYATIHNVLDLLQNIIAIALNAIWLLMQAGWDAILAAVNGAWQAIWGKISEWLSSIGSTIRDFFTNLPGNIRDVVVSAGTSIVTMLAEGVTGAFQRILDLGNSIAGTIADGIRNAAHAIFEAVMDALPSPADIAKAIGGAITGALGKGASAIGGLIPGGAKGGTFIPSYALGGTHRAPGGFAIVGERGPELVQFGGTSAVFPTNLFQRQLAAAMQEILPRSVGGHSGPLVQVVIEGPVSGDNAEAIGQQVAASTVLAIRHLAPDLVGAVSGG